MEMKYTLMTNKTLKNSTTKLDLSYREEATQFYSYIFYILYLKKIKLTTTQSIFGTEDILILLIHIKHNILIII